MDHPRMTRTPDVAAPCARCGAQLQPGSVFCSNCGARQAAQTASVTAVPPSPPPGQGSRLEALWQEQLDRLRGFTLGEYEILGELGRGGMAAVYLAHEIALDRRVAIKVMSPLLALDDAMVARFEHEARTMASLHHPNIVTIHAVRQVEGLHFFVMQFVEGRPFSEVLRETGPLPVPTVRFVMSQVSTALAYAHRRGVIHRDVKPANILIDLEGNAVVTDFGIAKAAESPSHTQTGATIGTPAYMSPEQCGASPLSGASDQYSLGVVAYEMLTGTPPFAGQVMQLQLAHISTPPPSLRERRKDCPPELEAAVLRMLAKAPGDRWPGLTELAHAIGGPPLDESDPARQLLVRMAKSGVIAGVTAPVSPAPPSRRFGPAPSGGSQPPTPLSRWPRGVVMAAVGAVTLAAMTLVVLQLRRPATGARRPDSTTSKAAPKATGGPTRGDSARATRPASPPPGDAASGTIVRIAVRPTSLALAVGQSATVAATPFDRSGARVPGKAVAWTSSDAAVVSVSPTGVVTARTPGAATLTATGDLVTVRVPVTVAAVRPAAGVARIVITPGSGRVAAGKSLRLEARVLDQQGNALADRPVTWTSADPTKASVTGNGAAAMVTAGAPGNVRIVAASGGQEGVVEVTVLPGPERPLPSPDSARGSGSRDVRRSEIREVLNQYVQAINNRSIDQLRAIYPALPADRESQWKDIFKNDVKDLKATLSVGDISDAGESAESVFEVQVAFTPARQKRLEYRILSRAILRRMNGVWRITTLRESGS